VVSEELPVPAHHSPPTTHHSPPSFIQPIQKIGEIAHRKGAALHVDAVAACGQVPINVQDENIDLLSISSNDLYGPKGAGALYIKPGVKIQSVLLGGGQERGLRSGTENVPGIVGMGKAAEIAAQEMERESTRLAKMRDKSGKGVLDNSHIPISTAIPQLDCQTT
jgi:cysteine desulfurase